MPTFLGKSIAVHAPLRWGQSDRAAVKLKGDLQEFAVADVVQFVGLCRKTGKVEIFKSNSNPAGELFFQEGEVIHAAAEGTIGEAAITELLTLREGTFQFGETRESPARTLHLGVAQILLRATQRLDEAVADLSSTFAEEPAPHQLDVRKSKAEMKRIVTRRLGRKGKKALTAIDAAEDDARGLADACNRVERWASLFFSADVRVALSKELRGAIESG